MLVLFQPDEWRTPQQISQLFSRLAAAQKQVDKEDITAEELEVSLASLRNEVMQQVASPQHPVVVGASETIDNKNQGRMFDASFSFSLV